MIDVALNNDTSKAPVLIASYPSKTRVTIRIIQQIMPFSVFALALLAWELTVRINNISHYILPAPTLVLKTLWDNLSSLMVIWLYTMKITFGTLLVGGVAHKLFLCGLWVLMAENCKTTWLQQHNMNNVTRADCDAFVSKVTTMLKAM